MAIIKQYHKDTNTTYVYESEYYYDKEKKQSRSKRKLIGKIDEETGQIVPTGKRGGRKKRTPPKAGAKSAAVPDQKDVEELSDLQKLKDLHNLQKRVGDQEEEISSLKSHMADMEELYKGLLAERDGTVKNLQSQVKGLKTQVQKYERAISGITLSLEKLNES